LSTQNLYQLARVSEQTARVYGGIIADRCHERIVAEIATAVAITAVAQIPGAGISRIWDAVHPPSPPRPEPMNMCLCVCVCMCVCVCVYICIYIYAYVYTYIHMYYARG